jgi:hypothetical protein
MDTDHADGASTLYYSTQLNIKNSSALLRSYLLMMSVIMASFLRFRANSRHNYFQIERYL